MLPPADIILICLLAFFAWRGWCLGIFRCLINPLALVILSTIGVIITDLTGDMLWGLTFVAGGTLVTTVAVTLLILLGKRFVQDEYRHFTFIGNRIAGCFFNLAWKSALLFTAMLFLSALPIQLKGTAVPPLINQSLFYIAGKQLISRGHPASAALMKTLLVFGDNALLKEFDDLKEYGFFYQDGSFSQFKNDPALIKKIEEESFLSLMVLEPKIRRMFTNPAVRKNFTKFFKAIYREELALELEKN